ncbi:unnamed protein product, partial [Ectocarpus sp. 12 AP-2014]
FASREPHRAYVLPRPYEPSGPSKGHRCFPPVDPAQLARLADLVVCVVPCVCVLCLLLLFVRNGIRHRCRGTRLNHRSGVPERDVTEPCIPRSWRATDLGSR